jgi:hypothetical protein
MDDETVTEATDVLGELAEWQLPAPHWERVQVLLGRLTRAWQRADPGGFRAAVADLESCRPGRALRIGSAGTDGVPEPVLDRRNTLLHKLGGDRPRRPAPAADPEDGRAGRRS